MSAEKRELRHTIPEELKKATELPPLEKLLQQHPSERKELLNQQPSETRVHKNRSERKKYSGYTVFEYFSHLTDTAGPGPGWDRRAFELPKYGIDDLSPATLPKDQFHYTWTDVEDERKFKEIANIENEEERWEAQRRLEDEIFARSEQR